MRRPVQSDSLSADQGRDDDHGGLREGADEDLPRHIGLRSADLLEQEIGLVGGQEGIGQDKHEAADEGPREVRALARVDVEHAEELAQRPRRPVRLVEPAVVQCEGEEQDEEPTDRARGQEHGEPVAGEQLDQEGRAHRRDRHADAQDARDQAALVDRDLVREYGDLGGEQRVEEHLGDAPSDQDDRDVGCQRDDRDAERTTDQADDHPRPPHAQSRVGPVAHLAEERVHEHREQGAGAGDERQVVGGPVDSHERVDLQRQADQQRREEHQDGAHVGQRVERDEAPADPAYALNRGRQPGRGRQVRVRAVAAEIRSGNVGHCGLHMMREADDCCEALARVWSKQAMSSTPCTATRALVWASGRIQRSTLATGDADANAPCWRRSSIGPRHAQSWCRVHG